MFVYNNDIYYRENPDNETIYRITDDENDFVYNGIADWIYEEEIFSSNVVRFFTSFSSLKAIYNFTKQLSYNWAKQLQFKIAC